MATEIDTGLKYLNEIKDLGFALQQDFIIKFKQDWGLKESAAELVIQIGHLTQALIENDLIITNKHSWPQLNRKPIDNIKDELADCFLSICSIYGFANITEEEIKKYPYIAILDGNYTKLAIDLQILSAQLLDSCEIFKGLKPKFNRDERAVLISCWRNLLHILTHLSEDLQYDIVTAFKDMEKDARKFLSNEKV